MLIRPATGSDVPEILKLQQAWCDEDITWGFVPDTEEGIGGYLDEHCLVAESQGKLIGFITWQVRAASGLAALPGDGPCVDVTDLYVIPLCRSQGVGGALLQSLIDGAEAEGVRSFKLFSGTKDIAKVISFYQRYGFGVVSVNMTRGSGGGNA